MSLRHFLTLGFPRKPQSDESHYIGAAEDEYGVVVATKFFNE